MTNEGLGLLPAPLGRRSAAFLIDALCLTAVSTPAVIASPAVVAALGAEELPSTPTIALFAAGYVLSLVVVLVQLVLHGLRGVTIGKRMLGLRSVNVDSLGKPGFWRIVLRALVLAVAGTVVPVLGALALLASPLWANNTTGRGWLDLLGRTWLLDVRAGLDPFDVKALRIARRELERAAAPVAAEVPSLATGGEGRAGFVPGSRSRSSIVVGSAAGTAGTSGGGTAPLAAQPVAPAAAPVVAPAPVPAPVPAAAPATAGALLVDHESISYVVQGAALIGRNPAADSAHPGLAVIAVADGTFSMSKTHARIDVVDGGIRLTDLGSSNGSAAVDSAGAAVPLASGGSTLIPWGGTLRLGDRAFAVYQPSSTAGGHA